MELQLDYHAEHTMLYSTGRPPLSTAPKWTNNWGQGGSLSWRRKLCHRDSPTYPSSGTPQLQRLPQNHQGQHKQKWRQIESGWEKRSFQQVLQREVISMHPQRRLELQQWLQTPGSIVTHVWKILIQFTIRLRLQFKVAELTEPWLNTMMPYQGSPSF